MTFQDYLDQVAVPEQRAALERLRQTIKKLVPEAEEVISYQLPTFRVRGKKLLALGAAAKHCALYPMSGTAVQAHSSELSGYSTSKGTIRFKPDQPLPEELVARLVRYRLKEDGLA